MVVISKKIILDFCLAEHKAKDALLRWYRIVELSDWANLNTMKEVFNDVDYVGNDRFVFNIGGNRYRIVTMIHFSKRTVYVRFIGTHSAYDKINCKTI